MSHERYSITLTAGSRGWVAVTKDVLPEAKVDVRQLAFERTETYTLGDDSDVELDIYAW